MRTDLERTGIVVAKDDSSPFIDRQGDISSLAGNEDAFFWKGKRGYHAGDYDTLYDCGVSTWINSIDPHA